MLNRGPTAADPAVQAGAKSLAQHGSTFHLAHRVLGPKVGADVERLYGFCRLVDNLVDDQPATLARRDLARVRADLQRGTSRLPEVQGYLHLTCEHRIDRRVTEELLAGFEEDLDPRVYPTTAELLRYCYRVAGTVGLLMCSVLDVDSDEALPFAIDLGVGMQLTNIARDVREDAGRGRVYLPADVTGGALTAAQIPGTDGALERRARTGIESLLALADRYYRSADDGMVYLPPRARGAVLVASRCYRAIGGRITRTADGVVPGRVFVPRRQKFVQSLLAAGAWLRGPWSPPGQARRGNPAHAASLHEPLKGLPGVHPSWRT